MGTVTDDVAGTNNAAKMTKFSKGRPTHTKRQARGDSELGGHTHAAPQHGDTVIERWNDTVLVHTRSTGNSSF